MKGLFFCLSLVCCTALNAALPSSVPPDCEGEKIMWLTWEEALQKQKENPKKIMVDIYTEWCGWCKRMNKSTFEDPKVIRYINENYYAVKFDAEYKEDIVFRERTFSYVPKGKRGYHALAAEITRGMLSYPTTVFLDENLKVIQAIKGYKNARDFEQIATYFGGNNHRKMPWASYCKSYKPIAVDSN